VATRSSWPQPRDACADTHEMLDPLLRSQWPSCALDEDVGSLAILEDRDQQRGEARDMDAARIADEEWWAHQACGYLFKTST